MGMKLHYAPRWLAFIGLPPNPAFEGRWLEAGDRIQAGDLIAHNERNPFNMKLIAGFRPVGVRHHGIIVGGSGEFLFWRPRP